MKTQIVTRKTRSLAVNFSLKKKQFMNGEQSTEKDVKYEGRSDYIYENTGSSDKSSLGKTAFCAPFGVQYRAGPSLSSRQRLRATACRQNRALRLSGRRTSQAVAEVSFSTRAVFDGTLALQAWGAQAATNTWYSVSL
jgi:hypothetical protein